MKKRTTSAIAAIVMSALSIASLPSEARAEQKKKRAPSAQAAHFHLTAADGRKTLGQILTDEGDLVPGTGIISRLHIFNSASHGRLTLVTIPGHDPDFNFGIDPGQDKDFPLTKEQDVALNEIPVECEAICNFYVYWEFFK